MTSFQDFGLADPIARALKEENYHTPTPIQAQTIPLALTGRDVVGIAQTGTGKTAAFALPILHRILRKPHPAAAEDLPRAGALADPRTCPARSSTASTPMAATSACTSALAIGGVPMGRQVRSLMRGVDVLVATPGRLLDLVQSNALKLGQVEFLVLDEADRMLDMGFINDIRKIVAQAADQAADAVLLGHHAEGHRRTRRSHAARSRPRRGDAGRLDGRAHRPAHHPGRFRGQAGASWPQLLKQEPVDRALVFTRTKHGADKVVKALDKAGIAADAIHGNKSQNHRERVLAAFRTGEIRTLVATDIAARGIDVDGISHVVNFDLPNIPETYVHRIGRTARAGADGVAISLVAGAEEMGYLRDIERLIRMTLPREDRRTPAAATPRRPPRAPCAAPRRTVRPRAHTARPRTPGA